MNKKSWSWIGKEREENSNLRKLKQDVVYALDPRSWPCWLAGVFIYSASVSMDLEAFQKMFWMLL